VESAVVALAHEDLSRLEVVSKVSRQTEIARIQGQRKISLPRHNPRSIIFLNALNEALISFI